MSSNQFVSSPSDKFISSIGSRETSAALQDLITQTASCAPIFRIDESPNQLCILFTADGGKRFSAFMTFIVRSGNVSCTVSKKGMYEAMDNSGCFAFDSSDYINEVYSVAGGDPAAPSVEFDASLLIDQSEKILSAVKNLLIQSRMAMSLRRSFLSRLLVVYWLFISIINCENPKSICYFIRGF